MRGRDRARRWALVGVLAAAGAWGAEGCLAGAGTGAGSAADVQTATAPRPVVVRVAPVRAAPEGRGLVVHGVTRSRQRGQLGFVDGGRLVERTVQLGQSVQAGDVLARLDPGGYRNRSQAAWAQVAQLGSQADRLAADRQRLAALQPGRTVSDAELQRVTSESEAVDAALQAARAQAVEADRRGADAVLRAPYAGVVVAVGAEPGELVAAGQPVVELAGDAQLEVEVQVPEAAWAALAPGQAADVSLPALGVQARGRIAQVASAARPEGLFPVVVAIDGDELVAGLTAEVRLQLPLSADAAVPVAAVVDPVGEQPVVYRVRDGVAEQVAIDATELLPGGVAVKGPVQPGDEVVVAGHGRLLSGDAVEVLR